MTKQKLMENYTMEQLAGMIITRDRELLEYQDKIDELKQQIGESKTIVDFLPAEPIKVADALINASYTRIKGELEKKIDKAFGNNSDVVIENVYSVSELRQIAEHLLVYCNANTEVK